MGSGAQECDPTNVDFLYRVRKRAVWLSEYRLQTTMEMGAINERHGLQHASPTYPGTLLASCLKAPWTRCGERGEQDAMEVQVEKK